MTKYTIKIDGEDAADREQIEEWLTTLCNKIDVMLGDGPPRVRWTDG